MRHLTTVHAEKGKLYSLIVLSYLFHAVPVHSRNPMNPRSLQEYEHNAGNVTVFSLSVHNAHYRGGKGVLVRVVLSQMPHTLLLRSKKCFILVVGAEGLLQSG